MTIFIYIYMAAHLYTYGKLTFILVLGYKSIERYNNDEYN